MEPVTAEPGRPVRTLAAFAAVTAEPGETAEVRLTVPARAFARYDETARAWVWPPGEFAVRVGRSSADLRLSVRVKSLFLRTELASPGRATLSCPSWCRLLPRSPRGALQSHQAITSRTGGLAQPMGVTPCRFLLPGRLPLSLFRHDPSPAAGGSTAARMAPRGARRGP